MKRGLSVIVINFDADDARLADIQSELAREATRLARQCRALAQETVEFFAHGARLSTIRYLA